MGALLIWVCLLAFERRRAEVCIEAFAVDRNGFEFGEVCSFGDRVVLVPLIALQFAKLDARYILVKKVLVVLCLTRRNQNNVNMQSH